ncbi:branched-chain amino acid ABC transporter substrate-binding protein [Solimicrobium silvestre]|uniref:ABC-type branched-chain amino acid transport systems periplasmic component n=1 Tax=Solimicrobium silvestre TaxID=2099400 RepID=A0A2S9GWN7_9BURK|nr:branched-chain amino acid ABC transporter substrate-binding protein [Solimicrobium silvestre]PRC92111.1 ABC-type branched-chain amino acid transport systems periplasmic component [Solimicrobium silvestre]
MQIKSTMIPLVAAIAFAFAGSTFAADDMIVKIGHVGPISGPSAHLGKDNENGAKMAIEELNAKGTMIGGKKVKFELLTEDDGGDPKQGTAAAQKLVDAKVNGVVGHLNSSTSIPAAKIYHDAGIPQISPSSTATAFTSMGYKSTFRVVANDGQLGGTLGRYAVQTLNAKTIAVIDDRTAYGQGVADEFVKGAKSKNPVIKLALRQFTNDKATDFNAILTSIKAAKPDVVFFGGMDSVAGPMLRQMKALGIKAKFMGGDGICTTKLPELAGDGIIDDQVICAEAGGVVDAQKKANDDFRVAFKKRFGAEVIIYAPYVYDSVMTLADAMQQAKSSDPAVYLPFLQNIHHKGITGDIVFDKKGDIKDGTLTMYTFKSGKRELMGVVK